MHMNVLLPARASVRLLGAPHPPTRARPTRGQSSRTFRRTRRSSARPHRATAGVQRWLCVRERQPHSARGQCVFACLTTHLSGSGSTVHVAVRSPPPRQPRRGPVKPVGTVTERQSETGSDGSSLCSPQELPDNTYHCMRSSTRPARAAGCSEASMEVIATFIGADQSSKQSIWR